MLQNAGPSSIIVPVPVPMMTTGNVKKNPRYFRRSHPRSPERRRVSPTVESRRVSTEQTRSPEQRLVSPTVESRRVSTEQDRSPEWRRVSPTIKSRRFSTEQPRSPERRRSTAARPERAELLETPGPAFLDRLSEPLSTAAVRSSRPCGLGRGRYSSQVTTCMYLLRY